MRISDWSSDVCSSDLQIRPAPRGGSAVRPEPGRLYPRQQPDLFSDTLRYEQLHRLHVAEYLYNGPRKSDLEAAICGERRHCAQFALQLYSRWVRGAFGRP